MNLSVTKWGWCFEKFHSEFSWKHTWLRCFFIGFSWFISIYSRSLTWNLMMVSKRNLLFQSWFQLNHVKRQRCINFIICIAKGNFFHSQNDRNNWISWMIPWLKSLPVWPHVDDLNVLLPIAKKVQFVRVNMFPQYKKTWEKKNIPFPNLLEVILWSWYISNINLIN